MAYDRYDRDERDHRWSTHRGEDHRDHDRERSQRGGGNERGFFERAGEEISSWFGGSDRDHRDERGGRSHDHDRDHGMWRSGGGRERSSRDYDRGYGRDYDRNRESMNRGPFASGGSSERDYNPSWRSELEDRNRERDQNQRGGRDYRPLAGDYSRGSDRHGQDDRSRFERSQSPWGRDEYRRTSFAGSREQGAPRDPGRGGNMDPHYGSWRDRHMSELDRDYDEYHREKQSRFESDFAGWREKRGQKREMMGGVRPHMDVVGKDGEHVGTVDKVAGDRLILTKSDPQSGGRHHSLGCSQIDRVEGNRVILDCSADQARQRWHDEERGRALFERGERGSDGPHILERSFEGTYRR